MHFVFLIMNCDFIVCLLSNPYTAELILCDPCVVVMFLHVSHLHASIINPPSSIPFSNHSPHALPSILHFT